MEIIKDIGAIVGATLSIISLASLCTKSGRKLLAKFINKFTDPIKQSDEAQNNDIKEIKESVTTMATRLNGFEEVLSQQCRDTIKNIYYKYEGKKKIPLYERKTADKTYDIYVRVFNGNSYAKLLYNEITKWDIDATTSIIMED